ncbi:MAG TPA: PASTA domain-containing protein [bacterium (Candidatus Stahlbacteria)]|nr:PASTA domain-containing protein [Candidatus Stahlbacteria bacterium]
MKKFLIIVAILLAIFAVGLLLFNYMIMPRIVRAKEIPVPDLIGRSLHEARAIARESNLNLFIETYRPDPVYPESVIIIQDPLPGVYVTEGRQISIVISSGLEKVRIPDLSGLELEKGMIILRNKKLTVAVESIPSETMAGIIVSSEPPPDTLVLLRSQVKILVSSGPEYCMPLLEGKTIAEALKILEDLEISLKIDTARTGGDTNLVILQYPDAGSSLRPGDSVRILIAR